MTDHITEGISNGLGTEITDDLQEAFLRLPRDRSLLACLCSESLIVLLLLRRKLLVPLGKVPLVLIAGLLVSPLCILPGLVGLVNERLHSVLMGLPLPLVRLSHEPHLLSVLL